MSERQQVISALDGAGVLAAIRWAYVSAAARTLDDYSEAAGHDAGWVGSTRFTFFRDRLDRVFGRGRYAVPAGGDAGISLDVLHAELSERDIKTMPQLASDLVRRSDLNGSPGWAWQDWRWLLASCAFGKINSLPWPQKSPTKQRVARQHNPDPNQGSLFDHLADEEVGGLRALLAEACRLDLDTFVVAHSLDPVSQGRELIFGRARINQGGGDAWHWSQDVLTVPTADGGQRVDEAAMPMGRDTVPDATVRLRHPGNEQSNDTASGNQ
jgi:hypothetical protein